MTRQVAHKIEQDPKLPVGDHLVQLRSVLIHSLIAVAVLFVLVYPFASILYDQLLMPLKAAAAAAERPYQLIYTGPLEVFVTYLKLSAWSALAGALPLITYRFWQFMAPAFSSKENTMVLRLIGAAFVLFATGVVFGYLIVLPLGLEFFIELAPTTIEPYIRVSEYFSLACTLLFAFGLAFQTPIVLIALIGMSLLSSQTLWRHWRVAIVAIALLSALLTPADLITMVCLAVPLTLLYFATLVLGSAIERRRGGD